MMPTSTQSYIRPPVIKKKLQLSSKWYSMYMYNYYMHRPILYGNAEKALTTDVTATTAYYKVKSPFATNYTGVTEEITIAVVFIRILPLSLTQQYQTNT